MANYRNLEAMCQKIILKFTILIEIQKERKNGDAIKVVLGNECSFTADCQVVQNHIGIIIIMRIVIIGIISFIIIITMNIIMIIISNVAMKSILLVILFVLFLENPAMPKHR